MRSPTFWQHLREILETRRRVIADHAWRDRDAAGHLEALKEVSGEIETWRRENPALPPMLAHYLDRCSYDKALDFTLEQGDEEAGTVRG
jgi:hypothetical protein